jgi:hypothetical protein
MLIFPKYFEYPYICAYTLHQIQTLTPNGTEADQFINYLC